MKKFIPALLVCLFITPSFSQEDTSEEVIEFSEERYQMFLDSINNSFKYQTGTIDLNNGLAEITVPDGFKFLDAEQSDYVLTELWGNPPSETLGMLLPEDTNPMSDNFTYAVEIEYMEDGYIDDEDAADIDYDELLETMQEDILATNDERVNQGYERMELVGWASPPYYDDVNKKLHWAKELYFEGYDVNTLNYNIRVLGRKGYLNLNAIGEIDILDVFNEDRDKIVESVHFKSGNKYSDFNPDLDKVAAYGIGGLIAGKVLAKTGLLALLAKFGKFIVIGVVGLLGAFKNKIFGGKKEA
ncbi:MAG: DUF2167 domain-containing protein [bacterium]